MKGRLIALLLAVLMATMSLTNNTMAEDSGRQIDDIDCSGYYFEDLFEYDNAVFKFEILDDWATADLYANSWVNETRAATVRDNLDGLFDGVVAGGGDDWISTDERDATRAFGAKCIADMYTRIGLREGMPHRGDVSWNNATFVEEGIGLDEVNLIPEDHPDLRNCPPTRTPQGENCQEVPVSATNNLEISMFTSPDKDHNTRFNLLPNHGQDNWNFTVAMNATNVTSASMEFTFPYLDGLRMVGWTIHDDGVENLDVGSVVQKNDGEGNVRVVVDITYDKSTWPMNRYVFFDMTTVEKENDIRPEWTPDSPEDNTIIPIVKDWTEVFAISGETMSSWASDDDDENWGLNCSFTEPGWSSRMISDDLYVTSGSSQTGTAECLADDTYKNGTSNLSKTWIFGQPATFSATAGEYRDLVEIESTPTLLVQNMAASIAASQDGGDGDSTDINLGSSSSTDTISLSGISPGEFMIHVTASSTGMLDWDAYFDLGLEKENTPPVINIFMDQFDGTYATWSSDFYSFSLSGDAIDPDGGVVDLSANLCGETTTSFTRTGANWDTTISTARCVNQGETSQYNVIISATDSAGAITTMEISIPDPNAGENNTPAIIVDDGEDSSGLPSIGIFATMISMLGAALLLRRD